MRNGYFQLVKTTNGYGVKLFPPTDGGDSINIAEMLHYLDDAKISYDKGTLKKAVEENREQMCFLSHGECPAIDEKYQLTISEDFMVATMRFLPPSETGKRVDLNEVLSTLRFRNICSGIQMQVLQNHFMSSDYYGTDLVIAKGKPAKHGQDDRIEYYFNTDVHSQPEEREDGSVDYFNLHLINHCKSGDVLARIIPGGGGDFGHNIKGQKIPPREVKHAVLKFGKNIRLSEDRMSITSMVDGHVMLIDEEVFVSDVYEVENVDPSTGNIDYTGSVQINGNVASNYVVNAGGNVIINGVVEGARITAGGNIVIARGMNGMSRGTLKAGGNVISKFIENATVEAEGYINTSSILHSNVNAGTEIVVTGKKGFITGGHVQAGKQITVKTLGAVMGASTIAEVGVDPKIKIAYAQLQKDVVELVKSVKSSQATITGFAEKRHKGVRFTEEQIKYVREVAVKLEEQKKELEQKNKEMQDMQEHFELQSHASIVVKGEVHPGTTIVIGDLSMVIQKEYQFCKFEVVQGEVKSVPM